MLMMIEPACGQPLMTRSVAPLASAFIIAQVLNLGLVQLTIGHCPESGMLIIGKTELVFGVTLILMLTYVKE